MTLELADIALKVPTHVRLRDELRIDFADETMSHSGRAKILLEGDCLAPMLIADPKTFGSFDEARLDTTNLPMKGGSCTVTATVMRVHETSSRSWVFRGSYSTARGVQQRTFTFVLTQ